MFYKNYQPYFSYNLTFLYSVLVEISFVNFNLDKVSFPLLKSLVKMSKNVFSKTSRFLSTVLQAKNVIETGYKNKKRVKKKSYNKTMMHSFEINIRICQPSKVMFTSASPRK